MSRAVGLRFLGGLVLLPVAALFSTDCGGNDVIDSGDAAGDANTVSDVGTSDDVSDAMPVDRAEGSSDDSSVPDAHTFTDAAPDARKEGGSEGGVVPALALGTAKTFALLASSTITNTGVTTEVTGDVGISPGTALVNLPPGQVSGTIHLDDAVATQAAADMAVAYDDLVTRPCTHVLSGVDLGGMTLAPGVYCFGVSAAQSASDLTLDAQGDPNASWVFQIGSTLTIASNAATKMINGGSACNVYWQVGSSATINTGARLEGTLLAKVSITLLTGASVSPGRVLTETAAVTLDSNAISNLGCP
jgi:Ice-binding-like